MLWDIIAVVPGPACTGNPEVSRHFHPRSGGISLGVPPKAGRLEVTTSQVEDVPGPTWQAGSGRRIRDRTEGYDPPALKLRRGKQY
ncbi:MAG: hypothetical protein A2785_04320 [Candidatus Chisholmbacteria bacterium RIFCSPHIGHO2_01_FULL_49_18]|uniref:Uncharacterized protein n=2 Tax=Candidatus Chisholmiibacteriota TaxID=1817900 RepID=A0A1G1VPC7_9BACT|nr:MAG: hypothetical protein A2785_04320 [Candidatus Chisholmbacteria bacterium RIFCSPHIGHO2_01_FULL_49_18]OGY22550.1 MAG: hypothetical protein A3A65_00985 [Candidatus Chisholmbacteria bacterium RIFCSPLOWO2_01_FULL_49_14]